MPVEVQLLESLDLFNELNHEELEVIAELMHSTNVFEGEELGRRGASARIFYIVLKGNFMVAFEKGRAFTLHHKGELMGWSTVVSPFRYTGTMTALTDGEVLELPGGEFRRLVQGDAALGEKLLKRINEVVAERLPYVHGNFD
jgi:CRP-like cAMP-binding protein